MTTISRLRVQWSGGTGLPGVSTFYCNDGEESANMDALHAFAVHIANAIPSAVTLSGLPGGEQFDDVTGVLVGGYAVDPWSEPGGTGVAYFAGVGGFINWGTDDIIAGRRVRGRTFMAPLTSVNGDADGTLGAGTVTAFTDGLANLLDDLGFSLRIWHRPIAGLGGSSHAITSASFPDKCTALKSRRR